MNEEPTYRFIRGTGWVPDTRNCEWASRVIGEFLVTVEKRTPDTEGEHYWTIANETCEELMEYIERDNDDGYLSDEDPPGALYTKADFFWGPGTKFAVVKVTRL